MQVRHFWRVRYRLEEIGAKRNGLMRTKRNNVKIIYPETIIYNNKYNIPRSLQVYTSVYVPAKWQIRFGYHITFRVGHAKVILPIDTV